MKSKLKFMSVVIACTGLACLAPSCTSEFDEPTGQQAGNQTSDEASISFSLLAPGSSDVLVRSASQPVWQESWEREVKKVHVYLFTADAADAADAQFSLNQVYDMNVGTSANDLVLSGDTYVGTLRFDRSILADQKFVKLAVLANADITTAPTVGSTLADLKSGAVTAALTANDGIGECDDIVGLEGEGAAKTGSYPMSCISEAKQITTVSTKIDPLELVRMMARVDIYNISSNVTITDVKVSNANNSGAYFFTDITSTEPVVPATAPDKIGLNPIKSYFAEHFSTYNGEMSCSYKPVTDYTPGTVEYELDRRDKNCFTAIYLFEQKVDDAGSSPVITIDYKLSVGTDDKGNVVTVSGSVPVVFKGIVKTADDKNSDSDKFMDETPEGEPVFMSVLRNRLYRVRIGSGNNHVNSTVEAIDWVIDPNDDINVSVDDNQGI